MLPGRSRAFSTTTSSSSWCVENGALSVGMFWTAPSTRSTPPRLAATAPRTTATSPPARRSTAMRSARTTASASSAGTTPSPRIGSPAAPACRRATARSLCATAGATRWGDRGYFWVSYYDRSFAFDDCTSYSRVDGDGHLRAQLPVRHPRLDDVAGLRGRPRPVHRLGRQPVHGESDASASSPPASTRRSPVRPTRCGPAATLRVADKARLRARWPSRGSSPSI